MNNSFRLMKVATKLQTYDDEEAHYFRKCPAAPRQYFCQGVERAMTVWPECAYYIGFEVTGQKCSAPFAPEVPPP